jgi:hypothetical protein
MVENFPSSINPKIPSFIKLSFIDIVGVAVVNLIIAYNKCIYYIQQKYLKKNIIDSVAGT